MKTSSLLQEKKDKSHNLVLKLNNQIFCLSREDLKKQVKTKPFYAYEYEGTYYDCGNKLEYLKAQIDFGLAHPEFGKPLRKALQQRLHRKS
mgnify:CR=1 FL=1